MTRRTQLDPREYAPAKNDIVVLAPGTPEWLVTKTRGSVLYLESVLGKRQAHTSSNEVTSIKRDWTYDPEPDWTPLYGEETADL
jgi:hypothetical protein